MSIQPGQHSISVQRRADYDLSLQFKDSAGVSDLTIEMFIYATSTQLLPSDPSH